MRSKKRLFSKNVMTTDKKCAIMRMKYILARLAVRGYETRNMKGIKIMGLIRAGAGALGGTLADQWKEFFYCDALPNDVLMRRGQKQITGRSSNTKGNDNIITNGSGIAVADGQCMMIVEQGKIVEVCAEPGEFVYDSSTEPSIFSGKLGDSITTGWSTDTGCAYPYRTERVSPGATSYGPLPDDAAWQPRHSVSGEKPYVCLAKTGVQ